MAKSMHTPYSVKRVCYAKPYQYHVPRPPKRRIRFTSRKRRTRKVNTEFHDALFSFGTNDQTSRLSDAEFGRQVVSEAGYLFDLGFSHLGKAIKGIVDLGKLLFSD